MVDQNFWCCCCDDDDDDGGSGATGGLVKIRLVTRILKHSVIFTAHVLSEE